MYNPFKKKKKKKKFLVCSSTNNKKACKRFLGEDFKLIPYPEIKNWGAVSRSKKMDKKIISRIEQIESLSNNVPDLINAGKMEKAMFTLGQLSNALKVLVKELSEKV